MTILTGDERRMHAASGFEARRQLQNHELSALSGQTSPGILLAMLPEHVIRPRASIADR
jgi:hypothetical protein